MRFLTEGAIHKVIRITGPSHNLLGLELESSASACSCTVEALGEDGPKAGLLDADEVIRYVLAGVSEMNDALGTRYQVKRIQYVPLDSPPAELYKTLAKSLVEYVHRLKQGRA